MSSIAHGGRLDEAVSRFGGEKSDWLDLSTGINPKGWKVPELDPEVWSRLPDSGAMNDARMALRKAYGVDKAAGISLASGSQAHIQLLPMLFKPQPVAVVGYTYQEHTTCWQRMGHEVYVTDGLESAEATARIVIVVNPNNPDGRELSPDLLVDLSRRLGAKGGLLVVDEAFCDLSPKLSVASECGRDGLLVLRSLGKFFGLAGVRFGAALTSGALAARLDDLLGEWAVSGPALEIARLALSDQRWQKKTIEHLSARRDDMNTMLESHGLNIIGGTSLFCLIEHKRAAELAQHLAQNQILVRSFDAKPEWLRLAIVTNKRDLNRLNKALNRFEVS